MGFSLNLKLLAGFRHDDETGMFVGYCPALDIYAHGRDQQEVERTLPDAVVLFVKNAYKRNILEKFLKDQGFDSMCETAVSVDKKISEFIDIQSRRYEKCKEMDIPINFLKSEDDKCPQQDQLIPA